MTLYSYCLRYDDGAAPNPFWGICTLAICKPAIRRTARVGDWVVGLGSSASPIGNVAGYVVYAMRVTERLTMAAYDAYCRKSLPGKIPDWNSKEVRKRVGDCLYDFSRPGAPKLRVGVHNSSNREVDLGGRNALLSEHFYYFGDHPRQLTAELQPIVHQTQGHKSHANARYVTAFVAWVETLGLQPNRLRGEPQYWPQMETDPSCAVVCSTRDLQEDTLDDVC